jgi:hypothetical protein
MDETNGADWPQEFESSNKAPHIFPTSAPQNAKAQDKFGGFTHAELEKMPAEQRLSVANRVEFEKYANKKKN